MNCVMLIGRMVKDPEIRSTQDGMAIANFTLAVDRIKRDESDFIRCTAFGRTAEAIEKYLTKGKKIAVEGRWQTGSYKDRDGNTVYTNDCIVNHWEFCESKAFEAKEEPNEEVRQAPPVGPAPGTEWMEVPDDIENLPFA